MDFNNHFEELNKIHKEIKKNNNLCCDNYKNYLCNGDGIIQCKLCNNSITNIIDSPEWRYYGSSDSKSSDPTRCGMPTNVLLPKSSLGTSISTKNRSGAMNKIGMYQRWNSMPYKERSLYKVFNEIQSRCLENNLPEIIITTSKSLYSIISETKISRGSNRKGIIAACVYYACKECEVPRSTNELASMFGIDSKVMTKGCKNYTEIMRMSKMDKSRSLDAKSINLDDFIERFSHKLSLNIEDIKKILQLSKICQDLKLINDNTPPAMASGCIYLYIKINDLNIHKKDISDICKISEVTINKCYKKLEKNEEIMKLFYNL